MQRIIFVAATAFLLTLCFAAGLSSTARAHLMPAQHGTLNFTEDGAYFVISIPVLSFEGIDDNHDGRLSRTELRTHDALIKEQVRSSLSLHDSNGPRAVEGLLINSSHGHHHDDASGREVVVMGRFDLAADAEDYRLGLSLVDTLPLGRQIEIAVRSEERLETLVFTPKEIDQRVFAAKEPEPSPEVVLAVAPSVTASGEPGRSSGIGWRAWIFGAAMLALGYALLALARRRTQAAT